MSRELPDRLLSPDGRSGVYAFHPDGSLFGVSGSVQALPAAPPPDGSRIRFMGETTVDIPLWGEWGLLYGTPDALMEELRVSTELTADIVSWARAWETQSEDPDHDAQARRLVERLNDELDHRYDIVFRG